MQGPHMGGGNRDSRTGARALWGPGGRPRVNLLRKCFFVKRDWKWKQYSAVLSPSQFHYFFRARRVNAGGPGPRKKAFSLNDEFFSDPASYGTWIAHNHSPVLSRRRDWRYNYNLSGLGLDTQISEFAFVYTLKCLDLMTLFSLFLPLFSSFLFALTFTTKSVWSQYRFCSRYRLLSHFSSKVREWQRTIFPFLRFLKL